MAQVVGNTNEIDPNCVKDPIVTDSKDYKPRGDIITPPQLYIVNKPDKDDDVKDDGDKIKKKGVILMMYDVFGWNNLNKHVFEFADQLAQKTGCCVIMPDFFRNNPCPFDLIPPNTATKKEKLTQWLNSTATKEIALNDISQYVLALDIVKNRQIGIIGFCWGGKHGIYLADKKFLGDKLSCVAALHPSYMNEQVLSQVKIPIYYGPAIGDFEASKAKKAVENGPNKNILKDCIFHQFENVQHGFCAGRGDWKDDKVFKQVEIAINQTSEFFKKYL